MTRGTFYVISALTALFATSCLGHLVRHKNYSNIGYLTTQEKQQLNIWQNFINAVKNKDLYEFKELSFDQIDCKECYTNTTYEIHSYNVRVEKLRLEHQDDTTYEYVDSVLIDIDKYLKEDFDIDFDNYITSYYADPKHIQFIHERNYCECNYNNSFHHFDSTILTSPAKEMLVSIGPKRCRHECSQTFFHFIQTKDGYKYIGKFEVP